MSADLYGYTRTTSGIRTATPSELAVLVLNNRQLSLVQGFSATLQQQVRTLFELGNDSVHFVYGYSEARAEFTRLAGAGNFFEQFQSGSCGSITGLQLTVDGTRPCSTGTAGNASSLRFAEGVFESLNLRLQAGQTEITESATARFVLMRN